MESERQFSRMLPKQYFYPTIYCNIYFSSGKKLNLSKHFRSKRECYETLDQIKDKVHELESEIDHILLKAMNRGCLLFKSDYIEFPDFDDYLKEVTELYEDEYKIFGE